MGFHMANNLGKAGFGLVLHDVNTEQADKLKGLHKDVKIAKNPKEVASHVNQVCEPQTHLITLDYYNASFFSPCSGSVPWR